MTKLRMLALPLGALLVLAGCSGEEAAKNCSVADNGDCSYDIICPDSTVTVHNGTDGTAGENGEDGVSCTVDENENGQVITCTDGAQAVVEDGTAGSSGLNALVRMESVAAGDDCPNGGVAVKEGLDANDDGTLQEAEVDTSSLVCNGVDGANGETGATLSFEVTPVPSGATCFAGGFRIDVGYDADGDGLETEELVGDPEYVCHGVDCTVDENPDGSATLSCQDGTAVTITNGVDGDSCTVQEDGAGNATITCEDGTTATISDGAKGEKGDKGDKGDSCSVTDNQDGTYLISCEDGTSVTVSDGQPGAPGADGQDGTDGESCSITPNADGSHTITCASGSIVVRDGQDGQDGQDGADGHNALVDLLDEPAGENCPYGGTKVVAGIDADADGLLDDTEITDTSFVCSGQPYAGPVTIGFDGFEGIRALERQMVSVTAQVEPTFDGDAPLQWVIVLRDAMTGDAVAGARAYYPVDGDGADHTTWTHFIETDADGVATFGPDAGFTAVEAGLFHGTTTDLSLVVPEAGAYAFDLALRRLDAGVIVGDDNHVFSALEPSLALDFHAFQDLREGELNRVGMTAEVASDIDPTTTVLWRLTLTDADGNPIEGAQATTVTDPAWTLVTDANGQTTYGPSAGFPVESLQEPTNLQIDLGLAEGSYVLTVELLNLTAGTVLGGQFIAFDVAEPFLAVTTSGFEDVVAMSRSLVEITAQASPDLPGDTQVVWGLFVIDLEAQAPVPGAKAYYPEAGDDPTDPSSWTSYVETSDMAPVRFGPSSGFPLSVVQAGVTTPFAVVMPREGAYLLAFALLPAAEWLAGETIGEHEVVFGAQPFEMTSTYEAWDPSATLAIDTTTYEWPTYAAGTPAATVTPGVKTPFWSSAEVNGALDAPVTFVNTMTGPDGLGVAGVKIDWWHPTHQSSYNGMRYWTEYDLFDQPIPANGSVHTFYTDADGGFLWGPPGGFYVWMHEDPANWPYGEPALTWEYGKLYEPSAHNGQLFAVTLPADAAAGTYTVTTEIVEVLSDGSLGQTFDTNVHTFDVGL